MEYPGSSGAASARLGETAGEGSSPWEAASSKVFFTSAQGVPESAFCEQAQGFRFSGKISLEGEE